MSDFRVGFFDNFNNQPPAEFAENDYGWSNSVGLGFQLVKDRVLQVTLDGIDGRDRKAQLVALLKSAASRL